MGKLSKNNDGFSAVEAVLVLVIVGLIAFIGYYVYHTSQATNKTLGSASKVATAAAPKVTNPYAGWKTATLQYEKITYKYPTSWSVTDNSINSPKGAGCVYPGSDLITLTSPSDESIVFHTGVSCIGDGGTVSFGAAPIQALGSKLYLALENGDGDGDTPTVPSFACLSKTSTPNTPFDFDSKNIFLDESTGDTTTAASFCYYPYAPDSSTLPAETVASIENSKDFTTAKFIFESMHY